MGVSSEVVTLDKASGMFDAAATTDSAEVWEQPANTVYLGHKIELTEQFAATSLTDLDFTIGNAGDNDGAMAAETMNLTSDTVGDTYGNLGAYFTGAAGYHSPAALSWLMYTTATGANLDTLTAGGLTCTFYYLEDIDTDGAYIAGSANADITAATDLSGTTVYFEAWGNDG